jgi:hypothetical protein
MRDTQRPEQPTKTRDAGKRNPSGTMALGLDWSTDIRRIHLAHVAETSASPLLCNSHTSDSNGGLWTPKHHVAPEPTRSPVAQQDNTSMLDDERANDLNCLVGNAPLLPLLRNEEMLCNTDDQEDRPARPYRLPACFSPDILRVLQPRAKAPLDDSNGTGLCTGASDAVFSDPSFVLPPWRSLDPAPCALFATEAPPSLPLLDTPEVAKRCTFAWQTALAMRHSKAERILLERPFQ